jgi:hypothetical protein
MTRKWGPKLRQLRVALADAIRAEQEAQAGDLPTPLHGEAFEITSVQTKAPITLFPVGMRVMPPAGGGLNSEVTEGALTFPVAIVVKGLEEADMLDLLDDALGLLLDAVDTDPTLGGKCGGLGDPGIVLQSQELDLSGVLTMVVGVNLRVRA